MPNAKPLFFIFINIQQLNEHPQTGGAITVLKNMFYLLINARLRSQTT